MGVKYYETGEPAPKQPKSVNVEEGIRSSDDDDVSAVGEDGAPQEEATKQAAAKELHFIPKKSTKTEEEVEATENRFGYSDVDIDLYTDKI